MKTAKTNIVTTLFCATVMIMGAQCVISCSSSDEPKDPCTPSYAGADACSKMKTAVEAKCPGETFDCVAYFAPTCATSKKFCATGIDACVTNVTGAANCASAKAVTCSFSCF